MSQLFLRIEIESFKDALTRKVRNLRTFLVYIEYLEHLIKTHIENLLRII